MRHKSFYKKLNVWNGQNFAMKKAQNKEKLLLKNFNFAVEEKKRNDKLNSILKSMASSI